MKVIHSAITDGLSGTTGNSVLMRSRSAKFSYLRTWAQPARTQQNDDIGKTAKNIAKFVEEMNPLAIEELKQYAKKYKHIPHYGDKYKERAGNWFAVWTLFIYNFAETMELQQELYDIDIGSTIEASDANSIKNACELNLLPKVDGWETLEEPFFTT